jgi:tetratricopeptide (TPR) repeat protein
VSSPSTRQPFLVVLYEQYLDHQDSAGFISKVAQTYTQGTLERLVDSRCPQVRRAAVLALGFIGDYEANPVMGRALLDEDRTVRLLAENGIRNVWHRAADDADRQQLTIIARLNSAQHYDEAIQRANQLLKKTPGLAETWNQRAIAYFARGKYGDAIRDCHEALEINPYHFAAAAGMGHAYLRLNNPVSALEAFRRALRLNPNLEGVRAQIARLTRLIEDK